MTTALQKEISNLAQQIKEKYQPEKIILFGSFAYGRPSPSSDADFAIIKKTKEKFLDRLKRISSLIQSPLGTDILVYTPSEWRTLLRQRDYFISEIAQKGKVLYEKK